MQRIFTDTAGSSAHGYFRRTGKVVVIVLERSPGAVPSDSAAKGLILQCP
jgi:hypothetical protein